MINTMKKVLFLLCLTCYFTCAFTINLPNIGTPGINGLTPLEEKQLGKEFMLYMKTRENLITDPLVIDYINNLGFKLVAMSHRPNQHFQFFIVKDSSINAFAGPDGYIGLHTGLILFSKTEGELASVLAHEIAHVTQRHIAQGMEAASRRALPTAAAMIAGAIVGNPALIAGAASGSTQAGVNYTRHQEQEADRLGIETLHHSGFDANDMARMFEHMKKASYSADRDRIEFLRTHPLEENRMAQAQNAALKYQEKKHNSSLHFYLIQTRLAISLSNNPSKTLSYFKQQLNTQPNNPVYIYGYALALAANNQYETAIENLKLLIQTNPDELFYWLSLSEIQLKSGRVGAALNTLSMRIKDYPDYYPLLLQYADVLIVTNHPKQAVSLLKPHALKYDDDIDFLSLYQKALGECGDLVTAYQVRAKIFLRINQPKQALMQLELAEKQPKQDEYTKASLQAQIKAIKKLLTK